MKKNDVYNIKIDAMSSEGMGICRIDGFAVFVANTAIGDEASIKIVKVLKSYAFGIVDKLLIPSTERIESDCPASHQCGGCVFRHISYEAEEIIKDTRVKETLSRIGGYPDFPFEKISSPDKRNFYRNKAQIPLGLNKNGELIMGFYGKHSHRIVDAKKCFLQNEDFNIVMDIVRAWHEKHKVSVYSEETHKGLLRHLYLRKGEVSNELMVCLVINGDKVPNIQSLIDDLKINLPNLCSFVLNINKENTNVILGKKCVTVFGNDHISDKLCGLDFRISPLSFFQVNRTQAEKLYEKAQEYAELKGDEFILDLYCGTGTIGLSMAKKAKKLIGIEIIPQAIENAKLNAKINGIEAEFICGDATKASQILSERNKKPDIVILDPPRKGLDKNLIDIVADFQPKKIIYISCDPATLARDLKIFSTKNYKLKKAQAHDLFPATSHVESVCLLTKN
ncbi:MAG: 23S rRNA (uracil(1939)-C(5))-methyltransferase RlmD [Clostridia bacterium]